MPIPKPSPTCSKCGRALDLSQRNEFMPFCSERCKMADLHQWMNESICIPSEGSDDEEDDGPEPPPVQRQWDFE